MADYSYLDIKCSYMNRKCFDDYYCNKVRHNVSYDMYIRYCTEYSYSDCPNYTACYVATEVCNELGKEKTTNTLNTLKRLRYSILEKDKKYDELLKTYDTIGPILASNLAHENNKSQIVLNLYNLCIEKVSKLINQNRKDEAIDLYKDMINLLVQGYGITDEYIKNDMNEQKRGHGQLVLIK